MILPIFLFIGILSHPNNVSKRNAIRQSWAQQALRYGASIDLKFILSGEQRASVPDRFNADIEFVDFHEDYLQLAKKTRLLMALRPHAQFVMKTDDDVYLNVDLLVRRLQAYKDERAPLYFGFFHERAFVVRHATARFAEPDQTDCQHHLPYASGAGYVVSSALANYLANPPLALRSFRNEDVAVGFWLAPLDKKRVHWSDVKPEREPSVELQQICRDLAADKILLQHRMTPSEIKLCAKFIDRHQDL